MVKIDITNQLNIKTWKFPGGEVHCKLSEDIITKIKEKSRVEIFQRIENSDDFLVTLLLLDAISRLSNKDKIIVELTIVTNS